MKKKFRVLFLLFIVLLLLFSIAMDEGPTPNDQVNAILQVAIPIILSFGVPIVTAVLKVIMDKLKWERATKRDVVSVIILVACFLLVIVMVSAGGILPPLPADVGQAAALIITWAFAILGGGMFVYNTVLDKVLTGVEDKAKK